MKIFNIISNLINLALASVFTYVALIFTHDSLKPIIIIAYIIFVVVRLKISPAHFYIAWDFLSKIKNKTDVMVNLLLTASVIFIIITGIMLFQAPKNLIPKVNIENDPVQIPVTNPKPIIYTANSTQYYIYPLATYEIAGIVCAKNTNSLLGMNALGPVDIGLVWGKLAEPENYKHIKCSSAFRMLLKSANQKLNLPDDYFTTHGSHNHIIPANNDIRESAKNLNINDKVILRGYLVDVKDVNGRSIWKSSLRRDDHLLNSGAGCEVFYVTDILKEI